MRWINLSMYHCRLGVTDVPGQGLRLVVVGSEPMKARQVLDLQRLGFLRAEREGPGEIWMRENLQFTQRQLLGAFPRLTVSEMPPAEIRLAYRELFPGAPAPEVVNEYQVRYQPLSKVGVASSMVPKNLEMPLHESLERVAERHGDIDQWVAETLGWTLAELGARLSPEQVDAVALALDALERGRGFIEADQTGLGKGRVLATLAGEAMRRGQPVVFLTEKGNLFTDIYRDLADVGLADEVRPFILNEGVGVLSPDGTVAFPPTANRVRQNAINAGSFPAGCNLVMATYSQFNRISRKAEWLTQAAAGAFVILDESHNAAGDSNTAYNIACALENAGGVVYSSATFAKGAQNMAAYQQVLPGEVTAADLAETLRVGGEPLLEIFSSMLTREGVMVRREHDLSNLVFTTEFPSDERRQNNEEVSDRLAEILTAMSYLGGDIKEIVDGMNEEIRDLIDSLPQEDRQGSRMGVSSMNFGSRLYNIVREFMLALKVDDALRLALEDLRAGKKPVIVLETTMESLLREMMPQPEDSPEGGSEEGLVVAPAVPSMPTTVEIPGRVTFRDVLTVMLERLCTVTRRNHYGVPTKEVLNSPEVLEARARIQALIVQFPDIGITPIDSIRAGLEAAGYRVGEVSGRGLQATETDKGDTVISVLPKVDRNRTIFEFNQGGLDSLALTRAGSAGISVHAGEKFSDQRQRVMTELQIANDVNARIQFFGRINRKGQVIAPSIRTLATGLPGEARLLAMQNAKLRRLSANTTSDRRNAAMADVPDVINPIGNEVCLRFLQNNLEVCDRLGLAEALSDYERAMQEGTAGQLAVLEETYFVNKVLGRISLLPVADQYRYLDEIASEYQAIVEELELRGENPLKARDLDWRAEVVNREVFESGLGGGEESVFTEPVNLTTVQYTVDVEPIRTSRLDEAIAQGEAELNRAIGSTDARTALRDLLWPGILNRQDELLDGVKGKFKTVEEALDADQPNAVKGLYERLEFLRETLYCLAPGSRVRLSADEGEATNGFVTRVTLPSEGDREHLLGQYGVTVYVPGRSAPLTTTLFALSKDSEFRIFEVPKPQSQGGYVYDYDWESRQEQASRDLLRAEFNEAPSGRQVQTRLLLDGNLYQAAQIAAKIGRGSSITYTDTSGARQRGVLMPRHFDATMMHSLPVQLSAKRIDEFLRARPDDLVILRCKGVPASADPERGAHFMIGISGDVRFSVPGTRKVGGKFFLDKRLLEIIGKEFSGTRQRMDVTFPLERLPRVVDHLRMTGTTFLVEGKHREWVNGLSGEADESVVRRPHRQQRFAC